MAISVSKTLDLKGLNCPLPIIKTAVAMRELKAGDLIEVLATDPGSVPDFTAWAKSTGNELIEHDEREGVYRFVLRKR
jgi:tRNA 2-thiouridine synthesizing protein A